MPDHSFEAQFNGDEILRELEKDIESALEEIGGRAEGYAQLLTPVGTPESTGIEGYVSNRLRQSIKHKVVGNTVYIGTNNKIRNSNGKEVPYPLYVELGTGIYATNGDGRKSPWTWYDKNGKPHFTRGMKPNHMLQKGVADHASEWNKILEKHMKG